MSRSIAIPGLTDGDNPIPAASVVGNILMSGAILGMRPDRRAWGHARRHDAVAV
ncbi:hypothetical protein [Gordonia sp. NPDC003376]